jgi:hypothetical protein
MTTRWGAASGTDRFLSGFRTLISKGPLSDVPLDFFMECLPRLLSASAWFATPVVLPLVLSLSPVASEAAPSRHHRVGRGYRRQE